MSDAVYTTREVLEQFSETIWFPLVLGMLHTIKELNPLMLKLKKIGLVSVSMTIRLFDRYVREYEHAVVTYVTRMIKKDLNIQSQYAGAGADTGARAVHAGGRRSNDGQANWLRDTFGDLPAQAIAHLDQQSQDNCRWLQVFSEMLALRKCNSFFALSVVSLIQRTHAATPERRALL